jgi:hypothetical protein
MEALIIVVGLVGPSQTGRRLRHDSSRREGFEYMGG